MQTATQPWSAATRYQARIRRNGYGDDARWIAMVVCVARDGEEFVDGCYKGSTFATLANAERSTAKYIAKVLPRTAA